MGAKPDPWHSLTKWLKALEERVNRLSNASPFFNTGWSVVDPGQVMQDESVIITPGGLLLVDGGDVIMLNEALVEVFRIGVMQYGDRGIAFRREDGSIFLEVRKIFGAGDLTQTFLTRDRQGRVTGGDALLSVGGFDAPHIPMPFTPVDYTSGALAQTTSATTFTALHEHRGYRQNPALKPQLMVRCSDATTSAEVQIYDVVNATYLGGFLGSPVVQTITVPTGTTAFTLFEFASAARMPGQMSDPMHLQIHVRRTAGVGSVTVAPVRTVGTGF